MAPTLISKISPPQRPTPNPPLYVHGRLKPTFTRKGTLLPLNPHPPIPPPPGAPVGLTPLSRHAKVEKYPRGFPQLACFLDSDDAFMVYRRFGSVFSRLLLTKQDEIRRMESTLEAMDRADKRVIGIEFLKSTVEDERRGELPEGWTEGRGTLMARLEKKVLEYCEYLYHSSSLFLHF